METVKKVNQNEVEEKLKAMRQRRLDRLSTFVSEQSKLSEARRSEDKSSLESIEESQDETSKAKKIIQKFNVQSKPVTPQLKPPSPKEMRPNLVKVNPPIPPLNPSPGKKPSKEDKILKKLQRNWTTLEEIFGNDSYVDSDEIEDLKNNLAEAENLLESYKNKIIKLEKKNKPINIDVIKNEIETFRGLKRDDSYKTIKIKLNDYLEVCQRSETKRIDEVKKCIQFLDEKAEKYQKWLVEILNEQVNYIYNQNYK